MFAMWYVLEMFEIFEAWLEARLDAWCTAVALLELGAMLLNGWGFEMRSWFEIDSSSYFYFCLPS
jgi:hypothetical protein